MSTVTNNLIVRKLFIQIGKMASSRRMYFTRVYQMKSIRSIEKLIQYSIFKTICVPIIICRRSEPDSGMCSGTDAVYG